jgi:hypothetical protein
VTPSGIFFVNGEYTSTVELTPITPTTYPRFGGTWICVMLQLRTFLDSLLKTVFHDVVLFRMAR